MLGLSQKNKCRVALGFFNNIYRYVEVEVSAIIFKLSKKGDTRTNKLDFKWG